MVAGVVVLIDQLTKWWALNALDEGPIVIIEDFFQFRLTFNTGASFSMLTGAGPLIAIVVFGVIGLIIFVLGDASRRIEAVSLGLVLGGAIGNLIDRLFRGSGLLDGAVVDFIDFSFFATFNVADAAVTIGVMLLLVSTFVFRRGRRG
ncbi:MAG: signal peptidase II [Acidimicrobiia bacterium]|nr:signal peptidase II [Acidimicrobiia bacterium]